MALKKLTERTSTSELASDAYILVTQTEVVDGERKHVLRRIPYTNFAAALGAEVEFDEEEQKIYLQSPNGTRIGQGTALALGITGLQLDTEVDDDGMQYLVLKDENGIEICRTEFNVTATGASAGDTIALSNRTTVGGVNTTALTIIKGGSATLSYTFYIRDVNNELVEGNATAKYYVNNTLVRYGTIAQGVNTVTFTSDDTGNLITGTNTIIVRVENADGNKRSLTYTVTVVDLTISSTFSNSSAFVEAEMGGTNIEFPYIPYGGSSLTKTIHFEIDGTEAGTVVTKNSGKTMTYTLPAVSNGAHVLRCWSTATVNSQEISSNVLRYDFAYIARNGAAIVISSDFNETSIVQGDPIVLPYLVYSPQTLKAYVTISVQYEATNADTGTTYWATYSTSNTSEVDRTLQTISIKDYPVGNLRIVISANSTNTGSNQAYRYFLLTVTESDLEIEPLTSSMVLNMDSSGRTNAEEASVRSVWRCTVDNSIRAVFSDFNWVTNGWVEDADGGTPLKISGEARLTIPFTPFSRNAIGTSGSGMTIDLDFMVDDVSDPSAVLLNCRSGNGAGFQVSAEKIVFASSLQTVETEIPTGRRMRITMVADSPQSADKMLRLYTNGVAGSGSGLRRYTSDSLQQGTPLSITAGADGATLYLYALRVYTVAHTARDVVANEIAHYDTMSDKAQAYYANEIYVEGGDGVNMSSIQDAVPDLTVMYLTGPSLPTAQVNLDGSVSKTVARLSGQIIDPDNDLCITFEDVEWDVQGTSSAGYFRKNIRAKFKDVTTASGSPAKGYAIKAGYHRASKITFKKDVASSEQANNTVMANYYNSICPYKTPPQEIDENVRQGIDGKPCVVFWTCTDPSSADYNNGQPQFVGKYNMNIDKGNDNVFGFDLTDENGALLYPRAQSWEFRNNVSDRCQFRSADFISRTSTGKYAWLNDFEARYAPGGGDEEDTTELAALFAWIVSTNTETATGNQLSTPYYATRLMANAVVYSTYVDHEDNDAVKYNTVTDGDDNTRRVVLSSRFDTETITVNGESYTVMPIDSSGNEVYRHTTDTATYREDKFYQEFEDHFVKVDVLFYYLFTEYYLMIDNRAKNMFITTYDGQHWLFLPYDFDTMMGINNEGALAFSYSVELTDTIGTSYVCNDQGRSVFWNNVTNTMASELAAEFSALETQGLFSPQVVNRLYEAHQGAWPMNLWNEDQDWTYGVPIRSGMTVNEYLAMWQGDKALQRYWWLTHRHVYMCSRYLSASALTDLITLRVYTPQSGETLNHVAPSAVLTLKSWQDVYMNVKWGSYPASARAKADTATILQPPASAGNLNDTETYIYSASALKDIGDLSPLYVGVCDVSNATHLERLILGSAEEGYENTNLEALTVGNNRCIQEIDVRGLTNLTGILDLSRCDNIRTIYAERTALTYVRLPEGGYLETLHVPAVQKLTITNQAYLTDFSCSDYTGISELRIENVPSLNLKTILGACTNLEYVRLTDVDWTEEDGTTLERLLNCKGIDENDRTTTGAAVVTGSVYVENIDGDLLTQVRAAFPYLNVTYGTSGVTLRFVNGINDDGEGGELLTSQLLTYGGTGHYPYDNTHSEIPLPTLASTAQYSYTFTGWSGSITNVTASRTVTATYSKNVRSYPITWKNGATPLTPPSGTPSSADYGTVIEWGGTVPTYTGSESDMVFAGWNFINADDADVETVVPDALRYTVIGNTVAEASFVKLAVPATDTPFASCTWGQIIALCKAAYDGTLQTKTGHSTLQDYGWAVGDETTIVTRGGESIVLKIWGFNINQDEDNHTLPVTIGMKYSLRDTHQMNSAAKYLYGFTVTGGGSTVNASASTTTYHNNAGAGNIEIAFNARTYLDRITVVNDGVTWTYYLNGARDTENNANRRDVNYLVQEDANTFTARAGKVEITGEVTFSYQNASSATSPAIKIDGTNGGVKIFDRNLTYNGSDANNFRAIEFMPGSKITIPMTTTGTVTIYVRAIWNNGGYYASTLRTWLNETFLDELPAIIQQRVVPVKRITQIGGLDWDTYDTYYDKLIIPTYREYGFGSSTTQPYCNENNTPFPTFSNNEMRLLNTYRGGDQTAAQHVWASSTSLNGVSHFIIISSSTGSYNYYGGASNSYAVAFGFCLR